MNLVRTPTGGRRRYLRSFSGNMDARSDPAALPDGRASFISGFDVTDGALTDGYGVEEVEKYAGKTGTGVWRFSLYDAEAEEYVTYDMYCDAGGYLYFDSGSGWNLIGGANFSAPPSAVGYRLNGEDSVLFTSPSDRMRVWKGGTSAHVVDSPYITSMAIHFERMFATTSGESNAVYFSDDLDPTNWNDSSLDEGGYVQLLDSRGRLLAVADFLNYVYVFREHGISRVTAYASQEDFSVANLYVAGGRIYEGSVCACGDVVMMLASDGLWSFDGYSASARLSSVRFRPSPSASALFSNGKYYLAACTESEDGSNDTLVIYDVRSGDYTLSRVALDRLCAVGDDVYGVTPEGRAGKVTACGALFGTPMDKLWESGTTDMDMPGRRKTVSSVALRTAGDVTLTVETEEGERSWNIRGGDAPVRVRTCVAGEVFRFRIRSSSPGARVGRLSYTVR